MSRYRQLTIIGVASLLFIYIPVSVNAQVGLAMSGPLVACSFVVVAGQAIVSCADVINTGSAPLEISFSTHPLIGPVDAVIVSLPSVIQLAPDTSATFEVGFQVMTAEPVSLFIIAVGTGPAEDGSSTAVVSIAATVNFVGGGPAYHLVLTVLDQWSFPYRGLEIDITRNKTLYTTMLTDDNGTADYLLANGTYELRISDNGVLKKAMSVNVLEDRDMLIVVERTRPIYDDAPTLHFLELIVGGLFGYAYGKGYAAKGRSWYRRRRRRKVYEP